MTTGMQPANPGVKFPPPFLFVLGLGVAWLLETYVRRTPILGPGARTAPREILAAALIIIGLILLFWGMLTFALVKTAILPMRPAALVVDHGPYRFSRNPMYAGMALAYLGAALAANSVWTLIVFPFVIALLNRLVIKREENYLSSAFGPEYDAYCKRVRRWI